MKNNVIGALMLGALAAYTYYPKVEVPEFKAGEVSNTEATTLFDVSTGPVESVIPTKLDPIPLPQINLKDSDYPEDIKEAPETKAARFFEDLYLKGQEDWDNFVRWIGPVRRVIAAVRENRQAVREVRQERAAQRQGYSVPEDQAVPVDPVDVLPDVVPEPEPTPVEKPLVQDVPNGDAECKCGPDCPCRKAPVAKAVVEAAKAVVPKTRTVTRYRQVKKCYGNYCRYEWEPYLEVTTEQP